MLQSQAWHVDASIGRDPGGCPGMGSRRSDRLERRVSPLEGPRPDEQENRSWTAIEDRRQGLFQPEVDLYPQSIPDHREYELLYQIQH